jgi:predicted amidophosphoribosyltransferase
LPTEPNRVELVDDLHRKDHYYLSAQDACVYHGEYTAGEGYTFSKTNSLILNFKKGLDKKGQQYKEQAIGQAAAIFRQAFSADKIKQLTFVPIPPSKKRTDPLYDDRMLRMLKLMCQGYESDIRDLIIQKESYVPSHTMTGDRPTPDSLAANYVLDQNFLQPPRTMIVIFDDVLTTGAHFKAAQKILRTQFTVPMIGAFIARRVPKSVEFDFDDLSNES